MLMADYSLTDGSLGGLLSFLATIIGGLSLSLTMGMWAGARRKRGASANPSLVRAERLANELSAFTTADSGHATLTTTPEADREIANLTGALKAEILNSLPKPDTGRKDTLKVALIGLVGTALLAVGGPFAVAYANRAVNPPYVSCVDERTKAIDLVEKHPEAWVPLVEDKCAVNDSVSKILQQGKQ